MKIFPTLVSIILITANLHGQQGAESELIFPLQEKHVHSSSIVELPNGDLLTCWFKGSGERTANDVVIQGARLKKGDAKWSKPFIMADTPGEPDCNPILFLNSSNKLFLVWIAVRANRWETSLLKVKTTTDYKDDDAPNWEWKDVILLKPGVEFEERVRDQFDKYGREDLAWAEYALPYEEMLVEAAKDPKKRETGWMPRTHPTILENGKILLPLYSDGFNFGLIAISEDDGLTWECSLPIVGRGLNQPSLVVREDGSIDAYMRDDGDEPGRILISHSDDEAYSWSYAQKSDIPNPGASVEVLKLKSGNWVLVYNDEEDGRYSLAAALSDDQGRSWKWKRKLENLKGGSFSYPSVIQAKDGRIHITYSYHLRDDKKSILHISIDEAWIKENSNNETGKEITLKLEPQEGNPRNSEGDFIQLKDGRILFIYTHFTGGTGDHAGAYLAGRYSKDGGKTWSREDELILPNEGGMNVMSVSLLRLNGGEVALFYLRKNSESDCIPFMRISSDEASTWSEPIRCMDAEGYHVVNNDRFVQLQDGRIIYPTSLHKRVNSKLEAAGQIMCYYSDDNGQTWISSQQIANPENIVLQEPGIIELKNDRLMLYCRTDAGLQYFSFSEDQGLTWSAVEPGNIKSPLSPASIERIPSTGDLLLVWNNNYESGRDGGKRTPFNLAISKDEGASWQLIKTIESDPAGWYCYTAIEFVDKYVLLGHCAGDTRTNNGLSTTQITRLSLDWIYQEATSDPIVASDHNGRVELSCMDRNAQIHYTLDGSLPTQSTGLLYQKPFSVDRTMPMLMQASKTGHPASQIVSAHIGSDIFQRALHLPFDPAPGLIYHYYKGAFNGSAEILESPRIQSGLTPQFSTNESHRNDNFALIFEGYIKIPEDGLYTFYLESNDGSVIYLDDHLLIDNDGPHGAYELSASTSLKAGLHKIAVRYFQLGGGSLLNVFWEGPDLPKQAIGAGFLFHETDKSTSKK